MITCLSSSDVGACRVTRRHAEPIIIKSNSGGDFSVQHTERIENDLPLHSFTNGVHVNLAEFGPRRRDHQSVGAVATFDRAGALMMRLFCLNSPQVIHPEPNDKQQYRHRRAHDLTSWTEVYSATHTNSPSNKFFRIKAERIP